MTMFIGYLSGVLPLVEIVLALLLVGAVLIQTRGAGMGAFQDGSNQAFYRRRGGELFIFRATIVLAILFAAAAASALFVR